MTPRVKLMVWDAVCKQWVRIMAWSGDYAFIGTPDYLQPIGVRHRRELVLREAKQTGVDHVLRDEEIDTHGIPQDYYLTKGLE